MSPCIWEPGMTDDLGLALDARNDMTVHMAVCDDLCLGRELRRMGYCKVAMRFGARLCRAPRLTRCVGWAKKRGSGRPDQRREAGINRPRWGTAERRNLSAVNAFSHPKTSKRCHFRAHNTCFDVLMRNSLFTRAQIREILVSRAPAMRAILINLSQKIAKPQTNISGAIGSSPANICTLFGSKKTNIRIDSK